MESQLFVSIDGNGIGKQIESYILTNSFDELKRFRGLLPNAKTPSLARSS